MITKIIPKNEAVSKELEKFFYFGGSIFEDPLLGEDWYFRKTGRIFILIFDDKDIKRDVLGMIEHKFENKIKVIE